MREPVEPETQKERISSIRRYIEERENRKDSRPQWKRKRWYVIAVVLFCLYGIPRFPLGPYWLYGDVTKEQRANPITYERLATRNTHPFRYGGSGKIYENAIQKWTSVRDCLVWSERRKDEPDLRLINWDAFWSIEEAEVCLWFIFYSLGNPERVEEWIRFQGFETSGERTGSIQIFPQRYKRYPPQFSNLRDGTRIEVIGIGGGRSNTGRKALIPSRGFIRIISNYFYIPGVSVLFRPVRSISVSATWAQDRITLIDVNGSLRTFSK